MSILLEVIKTGSYLQSNHHLVLLNMEFEKETKMEKENQFLNPNFIVWVTILISCDTALLHKVIAKTWRYQSKQGTRSISSQTIRNHLSGRERIVRKVFGFQ